MWVGLLCLEVRGDLERIRLQYCAQVKHRCAFPNEKFKKARFLAVDNLVLVLGRQLTSSLFWGWRRLKYGTV